MARDTILYIRPNEIIVRPEHRAVDEEAVKKLARSIKDIGLQYPITVRSKAGSFELIAGRHRLEACRSIGMDHIPANVVRWSDIDARLWEISENLHRAELTVAQRAEQIAEFARLVKEKREREKEVSDNSSETNKGGRPGAAAATARELGVAEHEVQRAVKIAAISDEAKEAAREAGLDDNQSALLSVAREPIERQVERVAEIKAAGKVVVPAAKEWEDVEQEQRRSLMAAWNKASPTVRAWFRENVVDAPVMDARWSA